MKETIDIKIVHRYLINAFGSCLMVLGFISILILCVFLLPYRHIPVEYIPIELSIILIVSLLVIITGFVFNRLRRFSAAKAIFNERGLNIISEKENVTIKFEDIKQFSKANINISLRKISFKIITKNSLIYEIKADEDVYESLIELFPDKE